LLVGGVIHLVRELFVAIILLNDNLHMVFRVPIECLIIGSIKEPIHTHNDGLDILCIKRGSFLEMLIKSNQKAGRIFPIVRNILTIIIGSSNLIELLKSSVGHSIESTNDIRSGIAILLRVVDSGVHMSSHG
jgi:hypothetical protein